MRGRFAQAASWLKLADPELTAVTMRVRTRSTRPTVSSEMVSATDHDVLVNHTSEVVSALCFDHLVSAPHSAYGRHVRAECWLGKELVEVYVVLSSDAVFLGGWRSSASHHRPWILQWTRVRSQRQGGCPCATFQHGRNSVEREPPCHPMRLRHREPWDALLFCGANGPQLL